MITNVVFITKVTNSNKRKKIVTKSFRVSSQKEFKRILRGLYKDRCEPLCKEEFKEGFKPAF